ncbi:MAG: pyruvate ferredoxin oxidoreductase [bacterium]|nr:pyruvate ferredoxin oxidoreductase [bacterium]
MAIATAVKLCRPDVIPMYPITPQTHIVERLADFINDGELNAETIPVESEHSAMSATIGAQATGVRTFTATASQGLALMSEIVFIASGMRMPIVMAVANRALSAPINIWNDQQDSIAERDSGWIQLYVESSQEALDTTIQAYKIAENKKIQLPVMVCLDGFTLSHVYEPVDIPSQKDVDLFLPKYVPQIKLDPKAPVTLGPVGFPDTYMETRAALQQAMDDSLNVIKQTSTQFKQKFGRAYGNGLIEKYKTNDADYAVVCMGSVCGTARDVVDDLRKKGQKVGMIKIKTFRPFPEGDLVAACKNLKAVAVLDKNISLGKEGALSMEMKSALCKSKTHVSDFIAGLGGRDITPKHIEKALKLAAAKKDKTEWLF